MHEGMPIRSRPRHYPPRKAMLSALCACLLVLISTIPTVQVGYAAPLSTAFANVVEGQTISGSYLVEATASDTGLVSNIKLYIDGTFFKTERNAPYEFTIDTTTYADSNRELKAVATDTSGNTNAAAAIVDVNIQNQQQSPPQSPPPPPDDNTGDSPLLIKVVTIRKGESTQAVISDHLDREDSVNNFRTSVLDLFPVSQHILNEASIPDIQSSIDTEIPESGVRVDYIMYDNERWTKTSDAEKTDPAGSTNNAADIVHDAGYKFAASPDRRTLIAELEGVDWQKVELLVIQSQTLVGKPEFKSLVEIASNEVRSENPDAIIFAQVNPSLHTVTQIVNAIDSVRSSIDGVSIVWKGDDATVLDNLLAELGR